MVRSLSKSRNSQSTDTIHCVS